MNVFFFLIKYNYLFPSFLACLAAKKVEDKRFTYPQSCSYKIPNLSHSSSLLYFERCILKYRCKTMFSPKIYNKNGDFIYFLLFELVGSFISFPWMVNHVFQRKSEWVLRQLFVMALALNGVYYVTVVLICIERMYYVV